MEGTRMKARIATANVSAKDGSERTSLLVVDDPIRPGRLIVDLKHELPNGHTLSYTKSLAWVEAELDLQVLEHETVAEV
jgi:hypothetical protein